MSGDVFNLFNNAAATDFLSKDIRSSLFNQPTNCGRHASDKSVCD